MTATNQLRSMDGAGFLRRTGGVKDRRGLDGRRWLPPGPEPVCERLSEQAEDRSPVLEDDAQPLSPSHLWEIDSPEDEPRDQVYGAIRERPPFEPMHRAGRGGGIVGGLPGVSHFCLRLLRRESPGRVSHDERLEVQPVFWADEPACGSQFVIEWSGRIR